MKIKRVPVFKLKVVYKSGHTHTFEAYEFSYNSNGYTWRTVSPKNRPVDFGAGEVAAVWQIGLRYVWRFV